MSIAEIRERQRQKESKPLPNVGKASIRYTLLYWFVYLYFNLYYRKFSVKGRENIPIGKPVIFAGNHQNALMDALSILFAAHGRVVFLARADLFKRKMIARILYFLRILPVYRIRDGISSMGQNEQSFLRAAEMLREGTPLALFPEGNHAGFKRLRSLKKGVCRIAFMAEEKGNFNLDLHIVPSGIDYSNYSDPGTRLLVQYGKPIRVADFIPLYRENPQKALGALRDALSVAMEPLMINIQSEENYSTYVEACEVYRHELLRMKSLKNNHHNRLVADKEIIAGINSRLTEDPGIIEQLNSKLEYYQNLLKINGIRDWVVRKRSKAGTILPDLLVTVLLFPSFLYGLILNYLPYKTPLRFTRKVKDKVFHSSIHFGIGLLLFPIYYLLLFLIFSLLFQGAMLRTAFALSLPLSGILTFYYYIHLLKLRGRIRLQLLKYRNKKRYQNLIDLRAALTDQIGQFIHTSKP